LVSIECQTPFLRRRDGVLILGSYFFRDQKNLEETHKIERVAFARGWKMGIYGIKEKTSCYL
jgi:hypothetical protein